VPLKRSCLLGQGAFIVLERLAVGGDLGGELLDVGELCLGFLHRGLALCECSDLLFEPGLLRETGLGLFLEL
jgi:hypothetical protein